MTYDVNKVIQVAENEVGYLEKDSASNLNSKTAGAGSGNYTKYWNEMCPSYQGKAWCQCFLNFCFVTAYGSAAAHKLLFQSVWNYYTPSCANFFKNNNRWYTSPQKGDVIYFKNSSRICHVGLVYKVDSSKVYTIEGNTESGGEVVANGGGVFKKSYLLSNSRIAGYGRPEYGTGTTSATTEEVNRELAKNIKNLVIPNKLNARKNADKTSTILGVYNKNDILSIDSVTTDWYHATKGWVKAEFVQTATATTTATLYARLTPDKTSAAIYTYPHNTTVHILAECNGWYLTEKGWCSGKYLK